MPEVIGVDSYQSLEEEDVVLNNTVGIVATGSEDKLVGAATGLEITDVVGSTPEIVGR